MWERRVFVVSVLYPIYYFFSSLMYLSSTFLMMRSLSCASVLSWTSLSKIFNLQMPVRFWRWKFNVFSVDVWIHARGSGSFAGCRFCDAGYGSEFGVIDDEGEVSMFPSPLLGLHRGRFDGNLVDEEGV